MDDIRATNVNIFSGIHKKGFVNKQEKGFVVNKKETFKYIGPFMDKRWKGEIKTQNQASVAS